MPQGGIESKNGARTTSGTTPEHDGNVGGLHPVEEQALPDPSSSHVVQTASLSERAWRIVWRDPVWSKVIANRIDHLFVLVVIAVLAAVTNWVPINPIHGWLSRTLFSTPAQPPATRGNSVDVTGPFRWDCAFYQAIGGGDSAGPRLIGLGIHGQNMDGQSHQLEDAHLESGITGEKVEIKVDVPGSGLMAPRDISPIPPRSGIVLVALFREGPLSGLHLKDFLDRWGGIYSPSK